VDTQGSRLKKIRKNLGLSQADFAMELSISRVAVATFETNKIKFSQDTLFEISKKFNVSLNYLICGQGEMFISNFKNTHKLIENEKIVQNFHSWGKRLLAVLCENNETTSDFAQRTGIDEARLEDFILYSTKPSVDELNLIKAHLDILIDELLYGENKSTIAQTNELSLSNSEVIQIRKLLKNFRV